MATTWRPVASLSVLKKRAVLYSAIRSFFAARGVLEVETPALSHTGATDPHIHSIAATVIGGGSDTTVYLHTSPEFPMKRLLAAGSGSIYQIAKVFRDGERGRFHHPEFALLEWYRVGFDLHALMDEMDALLAVLLGSEHAARITYQDAMLRNAGIDPHAADLARLRDRAAGLGYRIAPTEDAELRDELLDFIFTHAVQEHLGSARPTFVYDYPASQAALARVRPGTVPVAERFEVFIEGLELANGFHELREAEEQERRFLRNNEQRAASGLPVIPLDRLLLDSLRQGLPDCAGVALGLDRLLMILCAANSIDEVLAFPFERS